MSKTKAALESEPIEDDDSVIEEVEAPEEKAPEEEEDTSLANSDVTTKYQESAKIANAVLKELITTIVPGASVLDICKSGDKLIDDKLALVYRGKGKNGKPVDKGVAFPVCISVNEVVCHYSPLDSDTEVPVIAENDVVKIDLGVHIDGYIAVVAHTFIVPAKPTPEATAVAEGAATPSITGPLADVIVAAYTAADVAARLIRPGNTNQQVTDAIAKVFETYKVQPITGSVMHQIKRYVIDGNKRIALANDASNAKTNPDRVEQVTFEANEVYTVDIAFSTGEGKPKERGQRTTVYKRVLENKYGLKVKASRTFFNEVNKRFPTFPFSLRGITDEKNARLGLRECVQHNLLTAYPVLSENKGDHIGHFKFTVLVLPGRTSKITGVELPAGLFVPAEDRVLPEDIQAILAADDGSAKKKKKPAKKSAA